MCQSNNWSNRNSKYRYYSNCQTKTRVNYQTIRNCSTVQRSQRRLKHQSESQNSQQKSPRRDTKNSKRSLTKCQKKSRTYFLSQINSGYSTLCKCNPWTGSVNFSYPTSRNSTRKKTKQNLNSKNHCKKVLVYPSLKRID